MQPLLPGSTIGILGSGQLGRMLALSARRLGYGVGVFSPEADSPTAQIADIEFVDPYDDLDAIAEFASQVDVLTFEFENIPAAAVEAAARHTRVHPGALALHTTQHRLREKTFLRQNGFPCAEFRAIASLADLRSALDAIGYPAVLKTAGFGYDGKGQCKINMPEGIEPAFDHLAGQQGVLEAWIDFDRELSIVGARSASGDFVHYGLIENQHARHILDLSSAPALVPAALLRDATEIARGIFEKLEIVGVACVELFLTRSGSLLVNEIAPRTHNSGHLTIEACNSSQFEQQLRAVCGLPLGDTRFRSPAAMANLLGDLWRDQTPDWRKLLEFPDAHLHLYGKAKPAIGRKMGHVTALAKSGTLAANIVRAARKSLLPEPIELPAPLTASAG